MDRQEPLRKFCRDLMETEHITQSSLADLVGTSASNMSQWMNDRSALSGASRARVVEGVVNLEKTYTPGNLPKPVPRIKKVVRMSTPAKPRVRRMGAGRGRGRGGWSAKRRSNQAASMLAKCIQKTMKNQKRAGGAGRRDTRGDGSDEEAAAASTRPSEDDTAVLEEVVGLLQFDAQPPAVASPVDADAAVLFGQLHMFEPATDPLGLTAASRFAGRAHRPALAALPRAPGTFLVGDLGRLPTKAFRVEDAARWALEPDGLVATALPDAQLSMPLQDRVAWQRTAREDSPLPTEQGVKVVGKSWAGARVRPVLAIIGHRWRRTTLEYLVVWGSPSALGAEGGSPASTPALAARALADRLAARVAKRTASSEPGAWNAWQEQAAAQAAAAAVSPAAAEEQADTAGSTVAGAQEEGPRSDGQAPVSAAASAATPASSAAAPGAAEAGSPAAATAAPFVGAPGYADDLTWWECREAGSTEPRWRTSAVDPRLTAPAAAMTAPPSDLADLAALVQQQRERQRFAWVPALLMSPSLLLRDYRLMHPCTLAVARGHKPLVAAARDQLGKNTRWRLEQLRRCFLVWEALRLARSPAQASSAAAAGRAPVAERIASAARALSSEAAGAGASAAAPDAAGSDGASSPQPPTELASAEAQQLCGLARELGLVSQAFVAAALAGDVTMPAILCDCVAEDDEEAAAAAAGSAAAEEESDAEAPAPAARRPRREAAVAASSAAAGSTGGRDGAGGDDNDDDDDEDMGGGGAAAAAGGASDDSSVGGGEDEDEDGDYHDGPAKRRRKQSESQASEADAKSGASASASAAALAKRPVAVALPPPPLPGTRFAVAVAKQPSIEFLSLSPAVSHRAVAEAVRLQMTGVDLLAIQASGQLSGGAEAAADAVDGNPAPATAAAKAAAATPGPVPKRDQPKPPYDPSFTMAVVVQDAANPPGAVPTTRAAVDVTEAELLFTADHPGILRAPEGDGTAHMKD